jgi:hypothetical protein
MPNPTSDRQTATVVTIATALVLVASVMPWATVQTMPPFPGVLPSHMLHELQVIGTAWNGNLNFLSVTWPNSLVVLAAIMLSVFTWLQATENWQPPRKLLLGLTGYGLVHTALFSISVYRYANVGVGALLTLAIFAWILRELIVTRRLSSATPPTSST